MFEGRPQLIIYHFMFAPEWDQACPSCTAGTDEMSRGLMEHLHIRDTTYAMVSRAPLEKLERWRVQRGWDIPWYSSFATDFNCDYGATIDPRLGCDEYNYRSLGHLMITGTARYGSGPEVGQKMTTVGIGGGLVGVVVGIEGGVPGTSVDVPGNYILNGVACPSPSSCLAVGDSGAGVAQVVPITKGNPGSPIGVLGAATLTGVACQSATRCDGVGTNNSNFGEVVATTGGYSLLVQRPKYE